MVPCIEVGGAMRWWLPDGGESERGWKGQGTRGRKKSDKVVVERKEVHEAEMVKKSVEKSEPNRKRLVPTSRAEAPLQTCSPDQQCEQEAVEYRYFR
jgi:hypothetical protein